MDKKDRARTQEISREKYILWFEVICATGHKLSTVHFKKGAGLLITRTDIVLDQAQFDAIFLLLNFHQQLHHKKMMVMLYDDIHFAF